MLKNCSVTIYHKTIDTSTRLEKWVRNNFDNAWWFGSKGASVNKGYDNSNEVNVRIPYETNDVVLDNIKIGDILVKGNITDNITTQKDLKDYEIYNITLIKNNDFGEEPHLHLGGK